MSNAMCRDASDLPRQGPTLAKQNLAASLRYHASFHWPSEQLLKQLSQQLPKFVASAQQASHSDDAVALAQGCSHGSAYLRSAARGAALFPGELTSSLPSSNGGVGLVHVPTLSKPCKHLPVARA